MSAQPRSATVSIAIVSKGRPQILGETLESISRQTFKPQQTVVVVPSAEDLPAKIAGDNVQTITGVLGLTLQRNRAILEIPLSVDYVAFFDDDFELSPDYLECAVTFMEANAAVVGLSGRLLANGQIDRAQAKQLVENFHPEQDYRGMFFSKGKDHILHGCNMIIRRALLEYEKFDENLPFYSYGEDYDMTMRLETYGLVGKFAGCTGVHLEATGGRIREDQRGYSLVANNFYFIKKGSTHLPIPLAWFRFWIICVSKPLLISVWNLLKRDQSREWSPRIKGILLAVKDIFTGQCSPDRIKTI